MHNIRKERIRPPPKVKTCNWCRESIALDAFRCRYCQSYVKDIPGLEDCGVGMFVTIKKPKPTLPPLPPPTSDGGSDSSGGAAADKNGSVNGATATSNHAPSDTGGDGSSEKAGDDPTPSLSRTMTGSTTPESTADPQRKPTGSTTTTIGPAEGKRIAAELAQANSS
ncbi:hypothetical protein DFQ26_009942 [Actinomortierella ambigua]|nr:hypothetical protein DFQ26_009942 [Actinomortierella ambigua]